MPTTTPFNNLITFSRGSNATLTGSNGLIQWAPNNLLTFSEQFDNAAWTKSATGTGVAPTVTPNVAVAPDGTTTADLVVFNRGAGNAIGDRSWLFQTTVVANASPYATSIYIKAATALDIGKQIAFRGVAGVAYQIVTLTDSWVRINSVETSISTSGSIELASRGTVSADNQVSAHVWGAQLELGSTATTYNPTTVKNLLGFSEAFDNAAWTKTGASIVTGAQANPVNGLFNAQKLMENTANAQHRVTNSVTLAAAPYTLSAYLKAGERTWALMVNGTIANGFAYFNLSTGVVGSVGAGVTAASIAAVGSGWYRCAITFTAPAGSNGFEIRTASADGISIYTGDGNSGVYIYGAQLSDSASLDPYVPTPGAAPSSTAFYGPRFDFDPVTRAPRGLLVEEQRTNFIIYSDDFGNAAWTKSDNTVTTNTVVSPDGSTNADTATPTGATPIVRQTYTTSTTGAYTGTIWLRSASNTNVTISLRPTGAGSPVSVVCAVTPTWQRFTVNLTAAAGITNIQFWVEQFSQAVNLYGAQLEAGAFATSYIPTVASTVTRSADVATITGQNFAQWYRQDEGAFVVDYNVVSTAAASKAFFATNDGTSNNTNYGYVFNTGVAFAEVRSGGATQAAFNLGAATPNTTFKAAIACRTNDFAATSNGGAVITDLSGAVALNQSELNIGHSRNYGGLYLNGHIRNIRFIPARAADFQLQALST